MPSHSVKQAKTMSAIAHGWKPKGKAAGIPVKVAKEFHAADAGKKYGHEKRAPAVGKGESKPGYDRSSHRPGNPGFPSTGKASSMGSGKVGNIDKQHGSRLNEKTSMGHAKQPKGKSIGAAPEYAAHKPNQTYAQEQTEHWGNKAKGKSSMGKNRGGVGHIDAPQGSSLLEKCGEGHVKQGRGQGVGIKNNDKASEQRMTLGPAFTYRATAMPASGYGHTASQKHGVFRMSGHPGGHMLGSKKR